MHGCRWAALPLIALLWAAGGGREGVEPVNADPQPNCADKCAPGTYMETPCSGGQGPVCRLCPPGTHSETWNSLSQCNTCRGPCREELGLIELQTCTNRTRRRCSCRPGTFCRKGMGAGDTTCSDCAPHTPCPPGQGVVIPGDHSRDTLCAKCGPGTFSNVTSTSEPCVPHTNCSWPLTTLQRPGNSSADNLCHGFHRDVAHSEDWDSPGGFQHRRGADSTSVSLGVVCTLLFIIALATTVCLLQGSYSDRDPLQLSCFKRVFKSCVIDPEARLPDLPSVEAARSEDSLFPQTPTSGPDVPPPTQEACTAPPPSPPSPQEELLRGRSRDMAGVAAANQSAVEVPAAANPVVECGAEQATGLVGPVFIYNPACVYMGLINSREYEPLTVTEETAGSLPYPQQEACGLGGSHPEQENGKGEHLSEEASEIP